MLTDLSLREVFFLDRLTYNYKNDKIGPGCGVSQICAVQSGRIPHQEWSSERAKFAPPILICPPVPTAVKPEWAEPGDFALVFSDANSSRSPGTVFSRSDCLIHSPQSVDSSDQS